MKDSLSLFQARLISMAHILEVGQEYCESNGISERQMLGWRLADDMYPLRRQVQVVRNLAVQWSARAAGVAVPETLEGDSSAAELLAALDDAQQFVGQLKSEPLAEQSNELLEFDLGAVKPTLPIRQWISNFATTNILFHLSIAYGILRANKVPLQKPDLFAGGL